MITYNVIKEGRVYNSRGGDTGKVLAVGQLLTVLNSKPVLLGDRGECFAISAPYEGYFQVDRVKILIEADPAPLPAAMDVVLAPGSVLNIRDTSGAVVFTYKVP